ncbi:F-box/kelch-repeat protein At3g17530 [Ziziphus jujuba]|uniref:F-box/kelch-repeat protein At3g17530 n=1 Tax=Ziziphus jujuba TaxID=326968 RepID=A0A6P3YPX6_ZIZJJ|nr:F-box/kelch-repeat protein At3g17530 [Ziziphus jujuba]
MVCKSWLLLINSPSFIDQHLEVSKKSNLCFLLNSHQEETHQQSISIVSHQTLIVFETHRAVLSSRGKTCSQRLHIVSSCNGIVCLTYSENYETLALLWNPATRQTTKLHVPNYCHGQRDHKNCNDTIGFGFDAKNNDLNVVSITYPPCRFKAKVYSLKTSSWTRTSFSSKDADLVITSVSYYGVFSGGMYSWIASMKEKGKSILEEKRKIISFDMASGKLILTPLPCNTTDRQRYFTIIPTSALSGSFASVYGHTTGIETSAWMLGKYGVKESRTRLFAFWFTTCIPTKIWTSEQHW